MIEFLSILAVLLTALRVYARTVWISCQPSRISRTRRNNPEALGYACRPTHNAGTF